MFTRPLWCLFFGTMICLAVQDDSSDAKQKINKALGKAILKQLGLKTLPKPIKGLKEEVPQYIIDAYNNQGNQSEAEEDLSVRTTGSTCSRQSLTINFESIYGDNNFVIAPTSFNAYQCKGNCPAVLDDSLTPTKHAVFQNLVHLVDSTVQAPCCVPATLSGLSVIYRNDDGDIVSKTWENSIVQTCGCR